MNKRGIMRTLFFLCTIASLFSKNQSIVRIGWIGGMTSVPFVYIMDDTENFEFIRFDSIQSLTYNLNAGEIDAANLPINLALSLYEKTSGAFQAVCITQNIDYYIVCKKEGKTSLSFSDFLGKEIVISEGGLADGLINWILNKNNIPQGNGYNAVKIRRVKNESSAVAEVLNGKTDAALLTEPAASATVNTGLDFTIAIDVHDEFEKINGRGRSIPKMALIVRTQFARENPKAMQTLSTEMESAIVKINASAKRTQRLIKSHHLGIDDSVSANTLPHANFIYITAKQSLGQIRRYLEIYSASASAPPLTLPQKDFFYDEKF